MDESTPKRPPSISQLSKTPSWVMLGFVLGALFVWALPRQEAPAPRPIIVSREPEKPARPTEPPQLTTIEAVFAQWEDYAVWDHDATQVAMWNAAVGAFAEFYEVRRLDGVFYFRSIPALTNRLVRHGRIPPPECPLRFTETEEQYRDWREQGRFERPPEVVAPSVTVPPERPRVQVQEPAAVRPPSTLPIENRPDVVPGK